MLSAEFPDGFFGGGLGGAVEDSGGGRTAFFEIFLGLGEVGGGKVAFGEGVVVGAGIEDGDDGGGYHYGFELGSGF